MNYLLRNRKNNDGQNRKVFLGAGILIVLIIFLNFVTPNALAPLGSLSHFVARPFLIARNFIYERSGGLGYYFSSRQALIAQNEDLKNQLFSEQADLLNLKTLAAENESLKNLFGRTMATKGLILGTILQRPPFSPYDTFILDVGENEGIAKGDEVTFDGSVALGYIAEVYSHTSLARLYSSSGEHVMVLIEGQKTSVEALGQGGGNFLSTLPSGLTVPVGTHILLPGIKPQILGIVGNVENDVVHLVQLVHFQLPINLQGVTQVLVQPGSSE